MRCFPTPHVGVVNAAVCAGEKFLEGHRCRPMHGSHGTPVQMESRDVFKQGSLADVDRHLGELLENVVEIFQPFLRQEEGAGPMAGREGASQDPGRFGDVHPLSGLAELAEVDVGQLCVVGNARVVRGFEVVESHGFLFQQVGDHEAECHDAKSEDHDAQRKRLQAPSHFGAHQSADQ